MATLVSLKLTSAGRLIERSLVVPQCITLYNLHIVIQYALAPRISHDKVDAMVRGVKTTLLAGFHGNRIAAERPCFRSEAALHHRPHQLYRHVLHAQGSPAQG